MYFFSINTFTHNVYFLTLIYWQYTGKKTVVQKCQKCYIAISILLINKINLQVICSTQIAELD